MDLFWYAFQVAQARKTNPINS